MRQVIAVTAAVIVTVACGGGGNGPPTNPGPTTTSVSLTLRDIVLVGVTAQAAATATLSNGQTRAVTTGFRSDATSIAGVTDAGLVTGASNGHATISVTSDGRDATKRIRVAPSYDGRWNGSQVTTACTATGDFAGFCEENADLIGVAFPVAMTGRHPADLAVSGEFVVEGLTFPTFNTQVEDDGSIRFASSITSDGIFLEASWQMTSTQASRVSGTIRERFSAAEVSGEIVIESTFTNMARGASSLTSPATGRSKWPRR